MIFAIASTAHAQNVSIKEADARSWANNKGQELLLILSESNLTEKYAKLDRMMMEDVNIDYISKFVIGKYAKFMSNEQKTRYNELFQRYILSSYKQIDLHFDASLIKFTVDDIIEHHEFTTVKCTVDAGKLIKEADASIIPVKFKLIRGRFNRIQAVDLEIAKVSMVIE
jgi:ABC-type transporter MlaC component